jgi:hypothetical protein
MLTEKNNLFNLKSIMITNYYDMSELDKIKMENETLIEKNKNLVNINRNLIKRNQILEESDELKVNEILNLNNEIGRLSAKIHQLKIILKTLD